MAGQLPESVVVSGVTRSALGQKTKGSEVADTVGAVKLLAGETLLGPWVKIGPDGRVTVPVPQAAAAAKGGQGSQERNWPRYFRRRR